MAHGGGETAELPNVGEQMMQIFFGNRLIDRNKGKKEAGKKKKDRTR